MANTTFFEYLQNTEDAIGTGRIHDAMANCQHILTYFPDALEAQRLLGEVYLAQQQLEEAQQIFDWILVSDPENVVVYCNRALTSERLADIDTALDCYQQAYELSRGNSQIRQKFNQLSAKVGQQEFMFSRAGLARLYMRGDLLTQAEQEWEAVLSVSPERLDARTGLLETYWREGTYDKVEQLATQILEEIPNCLKALLLLAYVTSKYNLERSKELLQRAESLDPELVMAQELFSDLIASQPNDPFLSLLKKEPIVFSDPVDDAHVSNKQTAMNGTATPDGSHGFIESKDQVQIQSNLETWSELDTKQYPLTDLKSVEDASAFASWKDVSHVQPQDVLLTENGVHLSETNVDPVKSSPSIDDDFDPTMLEQQPWFQAEQLYGTASKEDKAHEILNNVEPDENIQSWSAATQDEDFPAPPAWLDVLTKFDRQPGDPVMTSSAQSQETLEAVDTTSFTQSQPETELASPKLLEEDVSALPASSDSEKSAFFFPLDEDNSDMEWPEWLKSLGAETMDSDPEPTMATPDLEPQPSLEFSSWTDQLNETLSESEQKQMATLQHLDYDLRSQGFEPLQPGTLATFAEEPSLSSALAELGNFSAFPDTLETPVAQVNSEILQQPAESTEPTSPLAVLAGIQPFEPAPESKSTLNDNTAQSSDTIFQQPTSENNALFTDTPVQNHVSTEAASEMFETKDTFAKKIPQETPLIPAYNADALLESELETTMKRPAIRLHSMQQAAAQPDTLSMLAQGRTGDRAKIHDSNLSYKELLLRGYQFQLAGAYDDAMTDYRIIIRNAPELLSEVISNMRALLKLSPRYSAGFRVLGDAYMRKGEYLQAMEAYNKALTIAKRAKSQSS